MGEGGGGGGQTWFCRNDSKWLGASMPVACSAGYLCLARLDRVAAWLVHIMKPVTIRLRDLSALGDEKEESERERKEEKR